MFRQIKLIMSLLLVFMLLAAPISPAGGASAALEPSTRLLSASDQGLSFSLHIPQDALKLEQVEVEGKKYTSISLPDGKTSDQVGAPMLPYMTEMLGVPFGVQLSISVIPGEGRKGGGEEEGKAEETAMHGGLLEIRCYNIYILERRPRTTRGSHRRRR